MHNHKSRPAHILFIVENITVPTDIRVWKEAKTARKIDYDVSIIAPRSKVFCKKYEVIDGIHIYRHPAFNNGRGKINQFVEYATAFLWEIILSWRVFLRKRFDIIHAANPPDHLFIIAKIFKPFCVRFVFDHHDLTPELFLGKFGSNKNFVYRLLILMERHSCRSADAVISTNESYKRIVLRRHGIRPESVFIVRNDPEVETKPSTLPPREVSVGDPTKLLYVGSINKQDGVDLLIKSLHLLVRQLRQTKIHCTVIGDGDHLRSVQNLCDDLGIGSFLSFTGYIHDRQIVKEYIANADICLETAPDNEVNRKSTFIKIMEYMAAGKPIVAFDLDETRFSAANSALLIEPGDLNSFAEGIMKLARDSALRKKLGDNGQQRIKNILNWDNSSKELKRVYRHVEGAISHR